MPNKVKRQNQSHRNKGDRFRAYQNALVKREFSKASYIALNCVKSLDFISLIATILRFILVFWLEICPALLPALCALA